MIKVLFICHGNICRSVSAQYIMQELAGRKGLAENLLIDSAATSTEEIGNPIYPPMRAALEQKGIPIGNHRARQLVRDDYGKYDLIIGMDEENMYYMRRMLGDDSEGKVHFLMEYTDSPEQKIDDPWYTRRFLQCADQIERGCEGLLRYLDTVILPRYDM